VRLVRQRRGTGLGWWLLSPHGAGSGDVPEAGGQGDCHPSSSDALSPIKVGLRFNPLVMHHGDAPGNKLVLLTWTVWLMVKKMLPQLIGVSINVLVKTMLTQIDVSKIGLVKTMLVQLGVSKIGLVIAEQINLQWLLHQLDVTLIMPVLRMM